MKRSFIFLFLFLFSVFCQLELLAAWSGKEDDGWYIPSLSSFTISTPEELAGLAKLVNEGNDFAGKTVILSVNIDLGKRPWIPIGNVHSSFRGIFDGNYHYVENLYIDTKDDFAGFFAHLGNVALNITPTIKNLGISCGGFIKGENYVGAIVAYNSGGIVENCYNMSHIEAQDCVGGIIGSMSSGSISNCFNSGAITAGDTVGGLVGYVQTGLISNSYNTGNILAQNYVGGLVGVNLQSTTSVEDSYNAGNVISNLAGAYVGSIYGFTSGSPINSYYLKGTASSGVGRTSSTSSITGVSELDAVDMQTASTAVLLNRTFNTFWVYNGGYPALSWERNIVSISTSSQLYYIITKVNKGGRITPGGTVLLCDNNKEVEIIPDECYEIEDVIVNGASMGRIASYKFINISRNQTIEAIFRNTGTSTVTATSSGKGRVFPAGDSISICKSTKFVFTPDECYEIEDVLIDGISNFIAKSSGEYVFNAVASGHHNIQVFFKASIEAYTVTTQNSSGGRIEPAGADILLCYDKEFFILPMDCYEIDSVFVDDVYNAAATLNGRYMFMSDSRGNHTIKSKFKTSVITIASAGGGGEIFPKDTLKGCTEKTFYFTPNPCYEIDEVVVDGKKKGAVSSYTFDTFSSGEHRIHVTFKPLPIKQYSILITTSGYGVADPVGLVYKTTCDSIKIKLEPDTCKIVKNIFVSQMLPSGIMSNEVDIIKSYNGSYIILNNISTDYIIHVVFAETGYSEIFAEADVGGSISPEGFLVGKICDDIVYYIKPDNCYVVKNLYVDGRSVGPVTSYTFKNVTGKHTIFAEFTKIYKITSTADTGGVIKPEGKILGWLCSDTTIQIIPDSCNVVEDVLVDGRSVGPVTSYTFKNVSQEYHTISAKFKRENILLEFEKIGNGAIYVNNYHVDSTNVFLVEKCSDVEIYIVPFEGDIIWNVLIDGQEVEFDTSRTIIIYKGINSGKNIRVEFIRNAHVLATASAGGSISPEGKTYFSSAAQVETYKITPKKEFVIEDVLVDDNSIGPVATYEFKNVTHPRKIHAEFVRTYTITSTASAGGSIFPVGTITLKKDATQEYIITPDDGYKVNLYINGINIGDLRKYTLTATKNHDIHVEFEPEGSIVLDRKKVYVTDVLLQPNPTSSSCTISANLLEIAASAELIISDISGREVMKLNILNINSEYLNYTFNTDTLSSGVYNISIKINGINSATQTLIIKK